MHTKKLTLLVLMASVLALASVDTHRMEAGESDHQSRHVHPNPFTDETGTYFQLTMPKAGVIKIVVFDMVGRHIRTLFDGEHPAVDSENVFWDGKDEKSNSAPPGVYVCVLFSEGVAVKSVKVVKIKR